MEEITYEFKKLPLARKLGLILPIFVIVVALLLSISTKKDSQISNESSAEDVYKCLMDENSPIETFENYQMEVIVNSEESDEWGEVSQDNGVRELELTKVIEGYSDDRIVMTQKRVDGTEIDHSYNYAIQYCDKDNMTSPVTYIESIDQDAVVPTPNPRTSVTSEKELPGEVFPDEEGIYRIDGLFFNGTRWILVDRIEITLK